MIDLAMLPLVWISGIILFCYRRVGSERLPFQTRALKATGVFPIRDHYYEPLFVDARIHKPLSEHRALPGINLRVQDQLSLLEQLHAGEEFETHALRGNIAGSGMNFDINNGNYGPGDAEFLFAFLRHIKPRRVIEIGCGQTTLVIEAAASANESEHGSRFEHICYEPYEQPWLKCLNGVKLLRKRIETENANWQDELAEGDLLFIDSSHMIRPQGDVLYEYLELIPALARGVYVHVHDIFTPRDYPDKWIRDAVKFWNEQYLLEAILSNHGRYHVIAALNFLAVDHFDNLKAACPHLTDKRRPSSFYFQIK